MRGMILGLGILLMGLPASMAGADDETTKKVVGGVISGLLGVPQGQMDAASLAQERERLVSFLQGGQYTTSRQGEPIDLMILGVPLTRSDHVYMARPIPSSPTSLQQPP